MSSLLMENRILSISSFSASNSMEKPSTSSGSGTSGKSSAARPSTLKNERPDLISISICPSGRQKETSSVGTSRAIS